MDAFTVAMEARVRSTRAVAVAVAVSVGSDVRPCEEMNLTRKRRGTVKRMMSVRVGGAVLIRRH